MERARYAVTARGVIMTEKSFSGPPARNGRLDPQRKDFKKDRTCLTPLARKDSFSELLYSYILKRKRKEREKVNKQQVCVCQEF